MSAHEIQALIDEHKEEMSDNLYLKLSNLNMKNKNENENNYSFYNAFYVTPYIQDPNSEDLEYQLELKTEKRIIRMTTEEYEKHNKIIKNTFNNYLQFGLLENDEANYYEHKRMTGRRYNDDDDDNEVWCYSSASIEIRKKEYLIKLEKIE